MMGYTASRMGRLPVGYTSVQQGSSMSAPVGVQGNIGLNLSGGTSSSGAGGLPGVLLVAAAGLAIFYITTRGVQGTRG